MRCFVVVVLAALHGVSAGGEEITRLKPMYLQTALVADGQPAAAIVVPDDPAYRPLADRLAEAVREACGVAAPVRSAADVLGHGPPAENLIALGVFANNRVVEDLYLREMVLCDYAWPGGTVSYVIRTVHNPWLAGKNVIYLGSATLAGCQAAVDRFIRLLPRNGQGAVGPIIEVVCDGQAAPGPIDKEAAAMRRTLERAVAQDAVYSILARTANGYFITGQPAWARLFLEAMRKIDQLQQSQADMAAPSSCQFVFQWFDGIEEGSAFSDGERLELANLLYRFAARLPEAKRVLAPMKQSAGNRVMAPATAAIYFWRSYPELELSRRLLANMKTFYEPDMQAWKPPEDSPHYANLTTVRSFRWALQLPDRRYVDGGLLRRVADYDMLITNNLGQMCGIGDYSGLEREGQLVEVYPLAAWLYRDGRWLWWWDRLAARPTAAAGSFYRHRGQGLMGWVPPEVLPRRRPDDLLGIARAGLDEWIYRRRDVAAFLGRTYEETRRFPIEECYDKVTFRAGFDRADQYLCLSGFGWGYHSHPDANAIVNYSDQGQTRLYDDGYMVAQPSEHNTVIVLREGWMAGIPELAQVRAQADFPAIGLFVSRLNDYSGVDWDRSIVWPKSRYFLVIDRMQARQAGRYTFQGIWRTLGKAELRGRRWESVNAPGRFHLVACSNAHLTQKPSAGTNLNAPPFAPDKARRLVESATVRLRPAESYVMANLFYSAPDAGRQTVNVARLGETTYLVDDDGRLAVAGAGRMQGVAGLAVEAEAFHLQGATLSAAGARRIGLGATLLAADAPINVQLDLDTGDACVEVKTRSRITRGESAEQIEPGQYAWKLPGVPKAALAALAKSLQTANARPAEAGPDASTRPADAGLRVRELWRYRAAAAKAPSGAGGKSPHPNAVRAAAVDGDGRDRIFVSGIDNAVHALASDGRRLWRFELPDAVDDLNVAGGPGEQFRILVGCEDDTVRALKADGTQAWSAVPPAKSYARPGYHEGDLAVHQGKPVVVFGADLDGDGRIEVVVGASKGFVYAFDAQGKLLWDVVSHTPHSMTCGAAFDLDGDGRKEIVMGNIYGHAQIFSADGRVLGRGGGTGHAGAVVVAAADVDGDGKGEVAVGDKLGKIWLQKAGANGRWSNAINTNVYDTGSDVTAVAMADFDADGKLETVAASKNLLVYLFDAQRRARWHSDLGDACVDLDLADVTGDGRPEIICACEEGTVQVVDAQGRVIARYQAPAAVRSVRAAELGGDPRSREIVASCEDGSVCALQIVKSSSRS